MILSQITSTCIVVLWICLNAMEWLVPAFVEAKGFQFSKTVKEASDRDIMLIHNSLIFHVYFSVSSVPYLQHFNWVSDPKICICALSVCSFRSLLNSQFSGPMGVNLCSEEKKYQIISLD